MLFKIFSKLTFELTFRTYKKNIIYAPSITTRDVVTLLTLLNIFCLAHQIQLGANIYKLKHDLLISWKVGDRSK